MEAFSGLLFGDLSSLGPNQVDRLALEVRSFDRHLKTNHSDKPLKSGHLEGFFANVVTATFELRVLAKDFQADVVNGRLPIFNKQDISAMRRTKTKGSHSRNGGITSSRTFRATMEVWCYGWRPSN